jgi:hypothetical protein
MRTFSRHLSLQLILLSFILIQITGCESLRISTDASPFNNQSTSKQMNRVFWGLINNKVSISNPMYRRFGIQRVILSVTKPQAIVSILTLGIYCPINYSYFLALTPDQVGNRNVSKSNNTSRQKIYDTTATGCHDFKFYSTWFTHDTVFHKPVVIKRWFWGFKNSSNQNDKIPNSSFNGGVESIDIHTKFWERLATFFTAGVYCPVTYTYKFAYLDDEYY